MDSNATSTRAPTSRIAEFDRHLFAEGRHWHIWRFLGAHVRMEAGVEGVVFATWAPNAGAVAVVGDFNGWDATRHPLTSSNTGLWDGFIAGARAGARYKFAIRARHSDTWELRTDPYGQQFELRPATAAIVCAPIRYEWGDREWRDARRLRDWLHAPMSVYELHLGSWRRNGDGGFLNYRELAPLVADHALGLGFTHIELLPITEHPLDDSWGYQATGYFAPTSRHGTPDDFRFFVDHCHQRGLGVLLDWVPAHFPRDAHALARFDGSALYEHEDPKRGEHRDWGTLIFNFDRHEVRNFLLASANFWLEEFHIDGLRVDAVASMLYLDYSREPGDWTPNIHGGRENLEAMQFLRELNELTHGLHPGTLTIAEESTAWPQVTRPVWVGGLGFSMKWNMGWMHDTLQYLGHDPVHRHYHHDRLTFGLLYAFSENFVCALSHDEVVHGKRSLLGRMPGDEWQRHANLRLLYAWQFAYPGTKLLFMGQEFAQEREWSHARALDWSHAGAGLGAGVMALVRDLNSLYRDLPALHARPFEAGGFDWLDCHDAPHSVICFLRHALSPAPLPHAGEGFNAAAPLPHAGEGMSSSPLPHAGEGLGRGSCCVVIFNFTPVVRYDYRIGLPQGGVWREALNTDSEYYGGSNVGNAGRMLADDVAFMGREHSLALTLPPLAALVLVPE